MLLLRLDDVQEQSLLLLLEGHYLLLHAHCLRLELLEPKDKIVLHDKVIIGERLLFVGMLRDQPVDLGQVVVHASGATFELLQRIVGTLVLRVDARLLLREYGELRAVIVALLANTLVAVL